MPEPIIVKPLHGRRVLVVEDEYITAEDLRQGLETLGVEVVGPVPSVARALRLLDATTSLDAAVLDINLGGETVFAVAEALQGRGIPFLFATGYDPRSIPRAYADVPRCEKPFDVGQCLHELIGLPRER